FLFGEEGFAGASEYYDPRNSYLNEVLARRCGIPITLALVYIAVARRAGIDARGISFPGHFLVRCAGREEGIVDAFHGRTISLEECEARLASALGPGTELRPEVHLRDAAALLLAIAPLALLEGGLRLAGWPTERVRSFGKLLNFDPQSFAAAVGVFRPGAHSTVLWPPELAYQVHINALGLRGPEIARTPPPGRTRILALGDSMTFGYYLEEGETWPARLEALLRAAGRD